MLNSSIYSIFERMWQHILAICSNYTQTEIFDSHAGDKENPHEVTAEQLGLDRVDNTSDAEKQISDLTQVALDGKTDFEVFNAHASNASNPHSVTAEQVGALSTTGGIMTNTLTLHGIVLTPGVDYGSGDPSGGTTGQLYFKKVTT